MGEKDFADIMLRLIKKECTNEEMIKILPKLKLVCDKIDLSGLELYKTIELLIEINKLCKLETVNEETLELIDFIYDRQLLINGIAILNHYEIMRYLLIPYNLNKCENEKEVYDYQGKAELLIALVEGILLQMHNLSSVMLINKYNKPLFDLAVLLNKCDYKIREKKINDSLLDNAISHLFGVFYFNQDRYDNDLELLEQITVNSINNHEEFREYCEKEGIVEFPLYIEDYKSTYAGIIKLLDAAYENKKEKKGRVNNE